MTTTGTPTPPSAVTQLANDAKTALKTAVQALQAGIDTAINDVDNAVGTTLTGDALAAAEAVIQKDAPPSVQPFVMALVGLANAAIQPELAKLDVSAHVELQLFRSKLDQFLSTLV